MKKALLLLAVMAICAVRAQADDVETLQIKGAEGMLHAELQKPASVGKKIPLVIICHGFGGNGGAKLLTDISADLAAAGIASLRFDFNGHGRSEGQFQDMTVPNEIEDLKNVIAWAQAQPWVRNISLVGHSQGGVVVSMTAGELGKKVVKSLVLMAPAAVLRDDALRGNTMGATYDPWNMTGEYVQLPWGGHKLGRKYIQAAVRLPIYETALKYTGPVLIVHGTNDRIVPYTYGERYHQGYRHSAIHIIEGEDHGFSRDSEGASRYVADWLINELH